MWPKSLMPLQAASTAWLVDEETIKDIIEKTIPDVITKNDMPNILLHLKEKMEMLFVEKLDEFKKPVEG